jgi:pimeloyl-ACP methyl ester carboxylesterase
MRTGTFAAGWRVPTWVLLAILLGLTACCRDRDGVVDEMVDVGGHSLHIYCVGRKRSDGNPTVVIDVGIGDSYTNWRAIHEQLGRDTRTCAYDRAGYGSSEPGPMPRHGQQVAQELKQLLKNAGIKGPYVLVGHSLGGLNVQIFASQYPDLVAGAVLLDPPPLQFITGQAFSELYQMAERQTSELLGAAEAARLATDPEEKAKASYYQTLASEHATFLAESAKQAAAIESFGDMPLIVLASGRPNPAFGQSAEAFQEFWIEQNRELAKKSTSGVCILAEQSTHFLYSDVPDVVLDAIRRVVEQARES